MSNTSEEHSPTPGAQGSEETFDADLQDAVAKCITLGSQELSDLNGYTVSQCDNEIHDIVAFMKQPTGKPRATASVLGRLTLLYHRKAELQAAEHIEQLTALQTSYQAEQETVSILKHQFDEMSKRVADKEKEFQQFREDSRNLQTRLLAAERQAREESAVGEGLVTQNPETAGAALPDLRSGPRVTSTSIEAAPDQSQPQSIIEGLQAELRESKARELALAKKLDKAQQVAQPIQVTPHDPIARVREPRLDPESSSRYLSLGKYPPSPPVPHEREMGAPQSQSAFHSVSPRSTTPFEGRRTSPLAEADYHPPFLTDYQDVAPPPVSEPYSWHDSHPGYSSTPQVPSTSRKGGLRPPHRGLMYPLESEDSDDAVNYRDQGMRTRQLESLARDIERFDPSNRESTIEDYLREVERCLLDLPYASTREKLRLIWKTTSRSVHVFMETLPAPTRDRYSALCQALREEYTHFTDHASATIGAFSIMHKKMEPPKEYYRRLRAAYFQGYNAPGIEEDHGFKSLFLHNLHESVRYDVTMHSRNHNLDMQEIRRYAQIAWETRVRTGRLTDHGARVLEIQAPAQPDLTLEGREKPRARDSTRPNFQAHQPFCQQGGRPNQRANDRDQLHNQGRPRQQNPVQTNRKVQFEPHNRPGVKFGERTHNPIKGKNFEQSNMEEFIRKCVTETMRGMNISNQPPVQPQSPKKPGAKQPPA